MTKIANTPAYQIKENIVLTDYFPGTNSETEKLETVSFRFQDVQKYLLSGLTPETGGTMRITEISYSGEGYSTASELLNALDPNYVVMRYHVVIVSVNGAKSLLKLQDITVGLGQDEVTDADFILFPTSVAPDGSETKITAGANTTVTGTGTGETPYTISGLLPPLEKINEGNGEGIVIRGRNSANYGNVGLNAVDLSVSSSPSSQYGATGELSFACNEKNIASNYGSSASGLATESSGVGAHTEGVETVASQYGSHAEGVSAVASGHSAHAQNSLTLAEGTSSHAGGVETIARALASFVHGYWVEANSFAEFSIGTYGTTPSGSLLTWVGTDRLFNIGNGLNSASLSDALTTLKNGLITFPSLTTALIAAEPTGKVAITKEYLTSVLPPTPDGSETKINNGITTTKTGNGTIATPYVIELSNPQKEITADYTLQAEDFNQTLFINNTIPITITIPITGLPANFCVGFVHETINDVTYTGSGVTNPIGLKSKGQGYQQFIERKLDTSTYYLFGNTKA